MDKDTNLPDISLPENEPPKLKPSKIQRFFGDKKGMRYFLIALGVIVATGAGLLIWVAAQPKPAEPLTATIPPPEPAKYYSPLTGVELEDESLTKRPVTAVMLENSPDARPQSGLKDAGIVYEAVAEGGITRFIALYQESRPSLIGPVRSVRPYYVEWAASYDPSVAHVGGSAKALQMIRSGKYGTDIDQFFNAEGYWRVTDRYAPHNVYTDFKHLDALNKKKGKDSSSFTPHPRKDDEKSKEPTATKINIGVSSGAFAVSYRYDAKTNTYARFQGGVAHKDREKGQISPKVVIAIKVNQHTGFEDGSREIIKTTGTGSAYIFQDGIVTQGSWKKSSATTQIIFLDKESSEIKLNRGQTWITALSNSRSVSWQ